MSVNHVEPRPRKSPLIAWTPLLIGAIAAIFVLHTVDRNFVFDTDEAALGQHTVAVFGRVDGVRIHCTDVRDTACLEGYRAAGSPPAVLWLGNSQLHGVNRYRRGQQTAPMRVHEALAARGRYLVAYSQPNANLLEDRILFDRLMGLYHVETLILPVCLDDFRESGVRPALRPGSATATQPAAETFIPNEAFSPQPLVEGWLEATLSEHLPLWRDRPKMKGLARFAVHSVRNRALGITAQTKRAVPQDQYAEKIRVLKAILAEAREAGVKVVLYAPAYRTDVPGPYVEAQYDRLLADLRALAEPGQVSFVDLTNAVPGPEWGMMKDRLFGFEDYDFMHFTAEGHKRLAAGLIPAI